MTAGYLLVVRFYEILIFLSVTKVYIFIYIFLNRDRCTDTIHRKQFGTAHNNSGKSIVEKLSTGLQIRTLCLIRIRVLRSR